jgi:hypothetical protein
MKKREKNDLIVELLMLFFLNAILFNVGRIFFNISFINTIIYSIINALWMSLILIPFTEFIYQKIEIRRDINNKKPLVEYLKNFERRQSEIQYEIQLEEKKDSELMKAFKPDDIIAKKFALEILKLIEIQIQQDPFISMNLTNIEALRVKTCLAIYNFSYFIFFMNNFPKYDSVRNHSILDKTYTEYYTLFKQNNMYTDVKISGIVVNANEQKEILRISRESGIKYEINVRTLLHNLFPMLYEIRVPIYLDRIKESLQNADNDIVMPFLSVTHLFTDQFLSEHDLEFATKFELIINLETLNRIVQMIKDID